MLSPIDGQPGSFTAKKLASVLVRLVDEQGAPLPGVLVSLSGGENNYRTNEQTGPNGSLSFLGLSPGEYFVKPVLKEYEFEPRSKLITVKEGAEELVEVTAKRIAFSLYGSVTGLKGEPEAGVTMEAIGQGECTKYQEEATTGQDKHMTSDTIDDQNQHDLEICYFCRTHRPHPTPPTKTSLQT